MSLNLERKKPKEKLFLKFNEVGYDDMTSLYLSSGIKEFIRSLEMEYIEIGFNLEHKIMAIRVNKTKGFCVYNRSEKIKASIATTTLFRYLVKFLPEIKLCTAYHLVKVDRETLAMSTSLLDPKHKINPKNVCFTWVEESKYKRKERQRIETY